MIYQELKTTISSHIFTLSDVEKYFPHERSHAIKVQLSRFVQKGYITRIKRGIYCFDPTHIDELSLSTILYAPSYVSLETALHYYGIIPDIPQVVTAISPSTTKCIQTHWGTYRYTKIKQSLFFGYEYISSRHSPAHIHMAHPEKALLDYLYIRHLTSVADLRLELAGFDSARYIRYKQYYPQWVQRIHI